MTDTDPPSVLAAPPVAAPSRKGKSREAKLMAAPVIPAVLPAGEAAAPPVSPVVQPEAVGTPAPPEVAEAAVLPAVYSDISCPEPAAAAAEPTTSTPEEPTMATMIPPSPEQATETFQNAFGDAGARFKTLSDKGSKLGEDMMELIKGNVEAVVASARVVAKGGETLGQDAADYGKKSFESAVAMMKSYASIKSPTELFQLQSDYARSSFDSMVAEASKLSESMLKLAGEAAQPLSSRYAVAAEKIKAATL